MSEKIQGVSWDLSSFFPAFGGPEMNKFKKKLAADIAALQKKASRTPPLSARTASDWERLVLAAEDAGVRLAHISAYLLCLESAHADREDYAAETARFAQLGAEYAKFGVDLRRALKDVPEKVFAAFAKRDKLRDISYHLSREREAARRTMSPAEEKLAADLGVDGYLGWERLYNKLSGKLTFEMRWPGGKTEILPISRWRALMADPDRAVGRAAFEGGNKAWAGIEDSCAAALNALAGHRLTLDKKRGVKHFLDESLFGSGIRRSTLDAMYAAVERNLEPVREILRVKAAAMGRKGIAFYEREAPLPLKDNQTYTWEEGSAKAEGAFRRVYPALGAFYAEFLGKRYLESEARGGKRPGAFFTGSTLTREGRVYMTFSGTLGDVSTLAHEMGHAWHGRLMDGLRHLASSPPMTLAETASIFAEHLLAEGIQGDPAVPEAQKLIMLDEYLTGAAITILDITVRFRFEKSFYEERQRGEVSAARLKELMVSAQREVFGDALADGGEDPLFWASKQHFYQTETPFYNYPYTFGFLMAATLFTRFKAEGPAFLPRYEAFLRLSGSDTAEGVARRSLGANIGKPEFWETAIKGLAPQLARYKKLLEEVKANA